MATPRASEAYAAWHDAKRAFDAALPWTSEWLRLRLIEQELRSEWEPFALEDQTPEREDPAGRPHHPGGLEVS